MERLFQSLWLGLGDAFGGLWTFCIVGGLGVILVALWFGKWFRFALYGVYGPRGMGDFSKIPKEAWEILFISFLLPSSIGRQLG
jgi:hypothetical protein